MKTPFKTDGAIRGARAITVLLAAVILCPLAPASGVTRLVEDYQVIQRDQKDLALFVIQLRAAARESSYHLLIVDDGGTIKKSESVRVSASRGERKVEVESVSVGGPYMISLCARIGPGRQARRGIPEHSDWRHLDSGRPIQYVRV